MKIKLKTITVPICLVSPFKLNWYHRDAKRLMKGKPWNSRKFRGKDIFEVYCIIDKYSNETFWLVELKTLISGEVRVSPMYEVELLKYPGEDYFRIKRK